MPLLIGQTVRNYTFQELIGSGGYGQVYRACQPDVGREVGWKLFG